LTVFVVSVVAVKAVNSIINAVTFDKPNLEWPCFRGSLIYTHD